MGNKINILDKNIDKFDSDSINNEIDRVIKRFSDNKVIINRMVFDSIALLTEAETAEEKLTNKGPLKRLIGAISGSNRKLADQIRSNRGKALYLAQQMLQKIAEEQLLTLDVIANIDNRLSFHIKDLNTKINNINKNLRLFLSTYKEGLIAISEKVEKHDRDIALLTWLSTLGYQELNGIKYKDLDELTKIVCIIKDFYALTQGNWSQSDLLMIRVALDNLNIPFDLEFNYLDALLKIQSKSELNNIFICNKEYNLSDDLSKSFIVLNTFERLREFESKDIYLIDVCKKINNNILADFELKRELIKSYVIYNYYVDIDHPITAYNLVLDFLYNFNYSCGMNKSDQDINTFEVVSENVPIDSNEEIVRLELDSYALNLYQKAIEARNNDDAELSYKMFKESSDAGNIDALYELAQCYFDGYGVEKDYSTVWDLLNSCLEQKNYNAHYLIGLMYEKGLGIEHSISLAKENYEKIIQYGNNSLLVGKAQKNLADILWSESRGEDDKSPYIELYEASFRNGVYSSITTLAKKFYDGDKIYKNLSRYFHYLTMGAEKNDSEAQWLLARLFNIDYKVKKHLASSYYWYLRAVDNGNVDAMYWLAMELLSDNKYLKSKMTMEVRRKKARSLLRKAAELGSYSAIDFIGDEDYSDW